MSCHVDPFWKVDGARDLPPLHVPKVLRALWRGTLWAAGCGHNGSVSHLVGQLTLAAQYAWPRKQRRWREEHTVVNPLNEGTAELLMNDHDDSPELDEEEDSWADQKPGERTERPVNRYRFSAKVARIVKAKMGTPKHSTANLATARDIARKYMEDVHVRRVDQAVYLPLAVTLVFVPDRYEVEAARFGNSWTVGDRLAEAEGGSVGLWQRWLGRKPGLGKPKE